MKGIFFDTNIYNCIKDAEMQKVSDDNSVQIITTPQILGELAATYEHDIETLRDLITKYEKFQDAVSNPII